MKVIYFATYYSRHYVRQDVIRQALRQIDGVELIECVYNRKSPFRYFIALWRFFLISKKDVGAIVVGFRAQEVLSIIRLLTHKPIIYDAFISLYDTLCFERKKFSPQSIIGKMAFWLDRYNCRVADRILLDTDAHIEFFSKTFNIPREKFLRIFVGANQSIFYPRHFAKGEKKFIVFYYGTALPLQGIDVILQAAKILENYPDILFRFVGPVRKRYKDNIRQLNLKNVEFIDWLTLEELAKAIAKADVCLGGHFSSIDKAKRVISGKTFQFISMKKPVITGKNKANEELFTDQLDCLMVEMGQAETLAEAVIKLYLDQSFRSKISLAGYQTFISAQKEINTALRECLIGGSKKQMAREAINYQ